MSFNTELDDILERIDTLKTRDFPDGNPFQTGGISLGEAKTAIIELVKREVVGNKYVDLAAKYEEFDGIDGIFTSFDDNESVEATGEKLALLANFVADKTTNEIIAEQRNTLEEK